MKQHVLSNAVKSKREAKRYIMKELERAQLRKNESNLIQAFRSFFNRAAMKQENDNTKPEYDTFEQVVAQKFDTRMQIVFLRNDFA